jgi:hypothetical protein
LLIMLLTIKDPNPGTHVDWDYKMVDENKWISGRAFLAFGASIKGFQYCCPLISINDTHLYDNYKVNFFIVVAYDTNNRVYLLCFAIIK